MGSFPGLYLEREWMFWLQAKKIKDFKLLSIIFVFFRENIRMA